MAITAVKSKIQESEELEELEGTEEESKNQKTYLSDRIAADETGLEVLHNELTKFYKRTKLGITEFAEKTRIFCTLLEQGEIVSSGKGGKKIKTDSGEIIEAEAFINRLAYLAEGNEELQNIFGNQDKLERTRILKAHNLI